MSLTIDSIAQAEDQWLRSGDSPQRRIRVGTSLGREAEAEVNALSREYINSDIDPAGNENVSVKLRLISDDEADLVASKNSEEVLTIRAEAVDKKRTLQMVTEEQAMTIERLTSLETQLELLTTSVEEKDQELARLQKSLDSLQSQPALVISTWANPTGYRVVCNNCFVSRVDSCALEPPPAAKSCGCGLRSQHKNLQGREIPDQWT